MSIKATAASQQNLYKLPVSKIFSFINLYFRISPAKFRKNGPQGILRGRRTLIHEKNLKSKSRVRHSLKALTDHFGGGSRVVSFDPSS